MFYEQLRNKFIGRVEENGWLNREITVETRALKPTEAIGSPGRNDFPLLKGREVLMQATFMGARGQAYTDAPSRFRGPLSEIIEFISEGPRQRALFIASLNAVLKYLNPDLTTVHCRDDGPERCAREIALSARSLKAQNVGLVGLQPAILGALVGLFGADKVLCVDRDEDNRNTAKHGVPIGFGDEEGLEKTFKSSDVVIATGSSVVNGSVVHILEKAEKHEKPVYFYGTTIAGPAHLLGLNRLCFESS
jgi:uncharacterized protein (DUF4213/DUF364 family)